MKQIYTPSEAIDEILQIHQKLIKSAKARNARVKKGEISPQSKVELERKDSQRMRDVLSMFIGD